MLDVKKMLYEICESESVYDEDVDLIESGLLDSYAIIELFSRFEDEGYEIQITQIDRNLLRSPKKIEKILKEAILD